MDDLVTLAVSTPADVAEKCEIGLKVAESIISQARKLADVGSIKPASEILKKQLNVPRIKICKSIDELLGGGIELGSLTELHGDFSVGKSQVLFQAAVNVQLPVEKGGVNGDAIYIDTENTFNSSRILQIAKAKKLDEKSLDRIHVARAYNSASQMLLIDSINEIAQTKNVKLLCVDSLTNLFRSDFISRSRLAERQQKLNIYIHALQRFADIHNAAVVYSNQMIANPDGHYVASKPVGGGVVAHAANARLHLKRVTKNERKMVLVDSSYLPPGDAEFLITENGIEDV